MNGYRIYDLNDSNVIYFKKTKEKWGGLSNMAGGYPLLVDNTVVYSSEALYQAMKFTHYPDIQLQIINQKSPMHSKMIAKKYKNYVRGDWDKIKIKVMRWTLLIKLMFNYNTFGKLLLDTQNKTIVELSHKDKFWGTVLIDKEKMIAEGENILGRLLMQIRETSLSKRFTLVPSPKINHFNFLGKNIIYVSFVNNEKIQNLKNKKISLL